MPRECLAIIESKSKVRDISSSDDDSLHEENIEYVEASPHDSELASLEAAEIVIPEVEEIEDDNLREKLLNETNTFHNSLPEFENFYCDLGEISSGSTTTHSDISLSKYDSFIFDLTHEEFVDELAHIISPPEYDCFYFRNFPDSGELMSVLNFGIRENLFTTRVNLPVEDDHSPLLAYVVWIFLAYLTYPVIPPYLHPFRNEDTIFDPGKLKTRWSGPFTITKVFPYGTVELSQANRPNFKVNGHRIKHYFGGDVPQLVVIDLQTFPSDQ
nr:reverse transcriptase domain-containing protein [Tanacetum cinerariifolium]